jgi:hypothetical protein
MATKNYKKTNVSEKMTDEEKINLYRGLSIILLGLMFIFFFFGWCYVYNTKYGVEVGCNGWNFICMSFCWNFKSANSAFGDMAVPFYCYAKYYVIVLEILTTIIFYLTLVLVALACINLKKPNRLVTNISMIVSIVYSVVILGAFVTALIMNASDILPFYCSGNPACSIQSMIIFPFLLSILILIVNILLRNKLTPKKVEEE